MYVFTLSFFCNIQCTIKPVLHTKMFVFQCMYLVCISMSLFSVCFQMCIQSVFQNVCESAVTAGQSIHAQVTKTSSDDAGNDGDDEYFEDDDDRRWCLCVSVVLMKRSAESKWQVDRSIHAQVTQMSILVSADRSCNSSRHISRYISPTAHSKSHCGKCKKKTLKITKITIFIDLNWCRKTWFFKMDWWV